MAPATFTPTPTPAPNRISIEDFDRMVAVGVFAGMGRVELIEGHAVEKMVPNPPHDDCVDNTNTHVRALVPAGWRVRVQSGITLSASVVLPDLCVAAGGPGAFVAHRLTPSQIALLVEVSDTTLNEDRTVKGPMYARPAWLFPSSSMVSHSGPSPSTT